MAGLLAGRVLSEHFERVTIVERDERAGGPVDRKGVPHGRHIHALLPRGQEILEELFPGIVNELVAATAAVVRPCDFRWYQGGWFVPSEDPGQGLFLTRALLEWRVHQRVRALANVTIAEGTTAAGLRVEGSPRRVAGATIRDVRGADSRDVEADLVVDATGRGSRLPVWLRELGLRAPPESDVRLQVAYSTCIFEPPAEPPPWKVLFVIPRLPDRRAGVVSPIEGGRWMVTLVGLGTEAPPRDDVPAFVDWARTLPVLELYEAVKQAKPLTPVVAHRFPSNLRRRYEHCADLPERLLVMGDAACSFNPRFGQGMTIAAMEALELERELAATPATPLDRLGRAFQRRAARTIERAWGVVVAEDLRIPEAEGERTLALRLRQWYADKLVAAMRRDARVTGTFFRVNGFLDPPSTLLRPGFVWRVLRPRP
jgi:2-polyprenyl-6-methoxyphenol hydroxylase-like FAD-dependent oxidoreductase